MSAFSLKLYSGYEHFKIEGSYFKGKSLIFRILFKFKGEFSNP